MSMKVYFIDNLSKLGEISTDNMENFVATHIYEIFEG